MSFKVALCKQLNKLFPLPAHPFNLQNQGQKTYGQWQYEKGQDTIAFFLDQVSIETMFKDKIVLDIGCGAAGKSLYYASQGANKVYGLDIVERYREEALALAREKGLEDKFIFVRGDASKAPFKDDYFDTIIMNDAMEHVDNPLQVLDECNRVLKPKGRLYVNFPPYYHPYGAHLSDAMGFPWVHLFFDDGTLIKVYKDLVSPLPDGQQRIDFRISKTPDGKEYFSYINKMTVSRFKKFLRQTGFHIMYYKEIPLRPVFKPLVSIPLVKEMFVKMVVCILEKP